MEGRRVVFLVAALVVAISAAVGSAVPVLLPEIPGPRLFGVLPLPATPLGYAVYGGATTAALLGCGLLLVVLASRAAESE